MRLIDLSTNQELLLPNDLLWSDEFSWGPVVSTLSYTLTGSLVIEQGKKQAGRAITLQADQDMAWVSRATLNQLYAWAALVDRRFALVLEYPNDNRRLTVAFNHGQGDPVQASPVKGFPSHSAGDWFKVTLKFLEVV